MYSHMVLQRAAAALSEHVVKLFIGSVIITVVAVEISHYYSTATPSNTPAFKSASAPLLLPIPSAFKQVIEASPIASNWRSATELIVKEGNRAVTVVVNHRTSVEGFARPGTLVDVLMTYVDKDGDLQTTIVSQAARVLSSSGKTAKTELDANNAFYDTKNVTLEVPTFDALRITNASNLVPLTLILRDPEDSASIVNDNYLATSVLKDSSKEASKSWKYCPSNARFQTNRPRLMYPHGLDQRHHHPFYSQCENRTRFVPY